MDLTHRRRQLAKLSKKPSSLRLAKKIFGSPFATTKGNEYRGAADLRCRGFTPGPNLEPGTKAGYLTIRFNARFTEGGVHAPSPGGCDLS